MSTQNQQLSLGEFGNIKSEKVLVSGDIAVPAVYKAVVQAIEVVTSKSSGKPMITITYACAQEGDEKGKLFKKYLVLDNTPKQNADGSTSDRTNAKEAANNLLTLLSETGCKVTPGANLSEMVSMVTAQLVTPKKVIVIHLNGAEDNNGGKSAIRIQCTMPNRDFVTVEENYDKWVAKKVIDIVRLKGAVGQPAFNSGMPPITENMRPEDIEL